MLQCVSVYSGVCAAMCGIPCGGVRECGRECGSENDTRAAEHAAMCGSARGVQRCNSARFCGNAVVCDSPWPCGSVCAANYTVWVVIQRQCLEQLLQAVCDSAEV